MSTHFTKYPISLVYINVGYLIQKVKGYVYLNISFLYNIKATIPHIPKVSAITIENAFGFSGDIGNCIFIPNIPPIIVGIDISIVTDARTFITIFKLLDITEAKKSIVLASMLL